MKRKNKEKLKLARTTVRTLDVEKLEAAGAALVPGVGGFGFTLDKTKCGTMI